MSWLSGKDDFLAGNTSTEMLRVELPEQLDAVTRQWRRAGLEIALVPTMGNLHEGHLALVKAAQNEADRVVCSLYVNPAQFGEDEDFERYPRTLEADITLLQEAECDVLFAPDSRAVYPNGLDNAVHLVASPDLAASLEGATRPGHFDGVVSVVARLFNMVRPDIAVFGEKDYQQLLVIRRLVEDLCYRIRILPVSTVREPSGLAMSTRNSYLEPPQKEAASRLHTVLQETASRVRNEQTDLGKLELEAETKLEHQGFRVDYFAVRRSEDLAIPQKGDCHLRLLAAVWSRNTRLIDNVFVKRVGICKV
jgi:pantoate--beta-alanine ligase